MQFELHLILMDEIQLSFIENQLFIWGVSSDPSEVFTSNARLQQIIENTPEQRKLDIPCVDNTLIVPSSMQLAYGQYTLSHEKTRSYSVDCVALSESFIIQKLLTMETVQGRLLGDSFRFFQMVFKFAISLVNRQRYAPYFNDSGSFYLISLDNPDDYELFKKLVKKAPDSIKATADEKTEEVVKNAIGHLANVLIKAALSEKEMKLSNETETDKWLIGLTGKKSIVSSKVRQGLTEWQKDRQINQESDFLILFRVHDPDAEGNWRLSFNLQSKKDASLIIRLDEVWNKKPTARIQLIKDLSVAAKVSKIIETQMYTPNPYLVNLSEEEAVNFMAKDSFFLKEMGFVVHIPVITHAKLNEFRVTVRLINNNKYIVKGNSELGKSLFDFDYAVSIGDCEVSQKEFASLCAQKRKLVNLGGKWVELNKEDMSKVIDFFEERKTLTFQDTMRMGVLADFDVSTIEVPEKFRDDFDNLLHYGGKNVLEAPNGFIGELRHYQLQGISWLSFMEKIGFGGILADDMGLGKTVQAIAYILSNKRSKSLIVCPTSVIANWQRELARFAPSLRTYVHHGQKRISTKEFGKGIPDTGIVLTSYAIARRDQESLCSMRWDTVFLDEAQNIKNPHTKQTVAIAKIPSTIRFCLTGTPIENRLSELWSILNFVNPGFLSTWERFRDNFAEPIELENDSHKQEILRKIISPFILRRLKTDKKIISDLPNKTEIKEYCYLTKEQATLYQAVVDESMHKIETCENKDRRAIIMAAIIKLKQVCNHPSNYLKDSKKLGERSGKIERLRELIEVILKNEEKCLIFTQYREMGALLEADLQNYFSVPVCFLHGGQTPKIRQQLIDLFQSDAQSSPKLFVLSIKAGGIGINLTKANRVIHFDRWWNPAVENQATDRAFRIGQKKDVFAHKFITLGTIEEKIDQMIERKVALSDSLLSHGEAAITELKNEQLRELFSLRKEMLEE